MMTSSPLIGGDRWSTDLTPFFDGRPRTLIIIVSRPDCPNFFILFPRSQEKYKQRNPSTQTDVLGPFWLCTPKVSLFSYSAFYLLKAAVWLKTWEILRKIVIFCSKNAICFIRKLFGVFHYFYRLICYASKCLIFGSAPTKRP